MNVEIVDPESPLLYASFNQDFSRLCVGTRLGFKIYTTEPFKLIFKSEIGDCSIVENLLSTKLVAVVGNGEHPTTSARKVRFFNIRHNKEICNFPFMIPVLSVRLNLKRIAIVTETAIHLYDIDMNFLIKLDTCRNPHGVCALTNDNPSLTQSAPALRPSLLAYPGNPDRGDLVLFDTTALKTKNIIQSVHQKPLRYIQFNPDDSLVATASEAGTLIHVQSVDPKEEKCYLFRRGMKEATISSIAFNRDSSLLCVSSNNGTVHIFRIQESNVVKSKSTYGFLSSYFGENGGSEVRSFVKIKLGTGRPSLCCFSKDSTKICILTPDGKFSQYQLDLKTNNAPKLVKQDNVLDDLEESPLEEQNVHSPEKTSNTVTDKVPVYLESPRYIMKAEDE